MGEARFQHVRKTPDIGEMHNLYSRDYDNQDKLQNVDEILATHFAPPSASAGRVFSTAVTGTVEFFVCKRLSPFASGCGPSLVGSVGLSVSLVACAA